MEFKDIASVSGKGGLFKVINPTRTGVILESMDAEKRKLIIGVQNKVSVLSEISVYTTDGDGAVPLTEVLQKVHIEYKGDTGLDKRSEGEELKAFLKSVLPNFDEQRVYVSDIKKLVSWYNQLSKEFPELFEVKEAAEPKSVKEATTETKKTTKAPKKVAAKK